MSHKLTPKQVRAVHMLVRGSTAVEVAHTLKLRRETLSRWKRIPEFSIEFEKVINDLRGSLRYRLTRLVDASISAVYNELYASESDPKRIQTALNVIKMLGNDSSVCPNYPVQTNK